jgi:hypothetical protein
MSILYRKYIPRSIVKDDNYIEWEYAYFGYLLEMFKTFKSRMFNYKKINWDDPNVFSDFCQMIYYSSSGYISENLECLSKENQLLYKDYINNL